MREKRKVFIPVLVALLASSLVILSLVRLAQTSSLVEEIRRAQVTNTQTLNNSDETLQVVKDCTQPTGQCFKDGQARTAEAVSSINQVVILAAACASQEHGQTVATIQQCVIDRLAASAHKK